MLGKYFICINKKAPKENNFEAFSLGRRPAKILVLTREIPCWVLINPCKPALGEKKSPVVLTFHNFLIHYLTIWDKPSLLLYVLKLFSFLHL